VRVIDAQKTRLYWQQCDRWSEVALPSISCPTGLYRWRGIVHTHWPSSQSLSEGGTRAGCRLFVQVVSVAGVPREWPVGPADFPQPDSWPTGIGGRERRLATWPETGHPARITYKDGDFATATL